MKLLRYVVSTYEIMRPERDHDRKSREIVMIFRHFLDNYEDSLDEVEITEYIEEWL